MSELSLGGKFARFAVLHAVAVAGMAYFTPGFFEWAHKGIVSGATSLKSWFAAYAASDPVVTGEAVSGFSNSISGVAKSIAGVLSGGDAAAPFIDGVVTPDQRMANLNSAVEAFRAGSNPAAVAAATVPPPVLPISGSEPELAHTL